MQVDITSVASSTLPICALHARLFHNDIIHVNLTGLANCLYYYLHDSHLIDSVRSTPNIKGFNKNGCIIYTLYIE
ncbi:hypothetical protein D3C77_637300 [compost metagenome]